jgi:L-ribulose-5-phosphate 3-epimerase
MNSIKRRTFLTRSIAATAALGLTSNSSVTQTSASERKRSRRPNPIAVSTYSFWRFKENMKLPIETCIDEAARMGFDGVDLLLIQMESEDNSYLQKLKRHALINGLDLCCMSTHQGYVYPDKDKRQKKHKRLGALIEEIGFEEFKKAILG